MGLLSGRTLAVTVVALGTIAGTSAFSAGAGSRQPALPRATTKWTRISTSTKIAGQSAGLYRTADGRLHVVWTRHDGISGYSLHYSTVGAGAKLLNTGAILSRWAAISFYPRLLASGAGIRLVFPGADGQSGSPYNNSTMYSATTSKAGTSWKLTPGSLSQSKLVPLTDDAAVNTSSGTPIAAWSIVSGLRYHVGVDPNSPAASPDISVSEGAGAAVVGPTFVRDKNGNIWAAWFNETLTSSQGYWVQRIIPSAARVKAPSSGGKNDQNNQPFQAVAFAARAGGGDYLAYCVPNALVECSHVALWKVGAGKALTVPGSSTKHAVHVAIAPGPSGHLWVLWYDTGLNKIRAVETNAAATKFGSFRTLGVPAKTFNIDGLQAEGSTGPLTIVALAAQSTSGTPVSYWATQINP